MLQARSGLKSSGSTDRSTPAGAYERRAVAVTAIALASSLACIAVPSSAAQRPNGAGAPFAHSLTEPAAKREHRLYVFNGPNGGFPYSQLTYDKGTFYGTATVGGLTSAGIRDSGKFEGYGIVFAVSKVKGKFAETYIYPFHNAPNDGSNPNAGVIVDAAGNIYGTTTFGGNSSFGAVFKLTPIPSGGFLESLIYSFKGSKKKDGANPYSQLLMDSTGALYGTTANGGSTSCSGGCGTVYKLTPSGSTYTETVLYAFGGKNDGTNPYSSLIEDANGALYGTTLFGGPTDSGAAYKLTPAKTGYTESIMYGFAGGPADGAQPFSPLVLGNNGVLYGTTYNGGNPTCGGGCGIAFALTPSGSSYVESNVYIFQGGVDGSYPRAGLLLNKSTLYGSTYSGGGAACFSSGCGTVFKLVPTKTSFTKTMLYAFLGENDGSGPSANLMMNGSLLYGTTYAGGGANCFTDEGPCGTIYSVKP